jgi:K+/H+ antiporter YhaU regulatory subunit KhtT
MVVLDNDIELFEVNVPRRLVNTRLAESNISSITGLVVVGLDDGEQITTAIDSSVLLQAGHKLVMLGTTEQRQVFAQTFD